MKHRNECQGIRGTSTGITLIELIVVMAILGIVATLAGPSMFSAADKFTLNSGGRQFVATLRAARNEARSSQKELLAVADGRTLIVANESSQRISLRLADGISVDRGGESEPDGLRTYLLLPNGQILGPPRLTLVMRDKYRGFVVLGPAPGAVHFEDAR